MAALLAFSAFVLGVACSVFYVIPSPGKKRERDFGDAGRAVAGAAAGAGMATRDYAYYEPGYRYGRDMAADSRYTGRDYAAAEGDLRGSYRADNDSLWDDVKDAVRHGYDRARNAVDRTF